MTIIMIIIIITITSINIIRRRRLTDRKLRVHGKGSIWKQLFWIPAPCCTPSPCVFSGRNLKANTKPHFRNRPFVADPFKTSQEIAAASPSPRPPAGESIYIYIYIHILVFLFGFLLFYVSFRLLIANRCYFVSRFRAGGRGMGPMGVGRTHLGESRGPASVACPAPCRSSLLFYYVVCLYFFLLVYSLYWLFWLCFSLSFSFFQMLLSIMFESGAEAGADAASPEGRGYM